MMMASAMKHTFIRVTIWVLVAVFFALGLALSPITLQCPTVDSAIFLTCAKWMQDGMVMYRDMFDHKGPLIYYFDQIGLLGGLTGVWCLCIIWLLVTTHFVYKICRLFTNEVSSFVASLFFIFMMEVTGVDNTVELVAMPFVALGMLTLLRPLTAKHDVSYFSVFVASFCLSVMFLLKPNIGAGIAFLALVVFLKLICNFSIQRFLGYLLSFLLGIAVVFIPLYAMLKSNGAWNDYVSTFWKFNMEYSSNMSLGVKALNFAQLFFCYVPSFVSWVFVIYVLVKSHNTIQKTENLCLLAMLLFTGLLSMGLSGFRFGHYLLPVFPIYAIFIAKAVQLVEEKQVYALYSILVLWACYFGYKQFESYKYANRTSLQALLSTVDYVKSHTKEDDKICLYGVDASVYLFSERKSVTKYIYQNPIFGIRPSMYKEFVEDILKGRPSLLLLGKNDKLPSNIMQNYLYEGSIKNEIAIFRLK